MGIKGCWTCRGKALNNESLAICMLTDRLLQGARSGVTCNGHNVETVPEPGASVKALASSSLGLEMAIGKERNSQETRVTLGIIFNFVPRDS